MAKMQNKHSSACRYKLCNCITTSPTSRDKEKTELYLAVKEEFIPHNINDWERGYLAGTKSVDESYEPPEANASDDYINGWEKGLDEATPLVSKNDYYTSNFIDISEYSTESPRFSRSSLIS
jgi:hypothetical protein